MLLSLKIENFALIDRLELELYAGLNILTGETGAGKSIVLDALDATLGGKVSARMLRTGASRANIEATFSTNEAIAQWLEIQEIDALDDEILICSREITARSNRTRINGVVANKQQIQELRDRLVEITAQGQTILLSQASQQREWLDNFGDPTLLQQRQKVAKLFEIKERSRKALFDRQQNDRSRLQHLDMLRYQLKELEAANLDDPDELENLESDRNRLAYSVELQKQGYVVYEALYQNDGGNACADLLGQAETILTEMMALDREAEGILELVSSALAQVEEAGRQINTYANRLESDPEQLESIEQRINQIKQICRKYGSTLPEAIAYTEKLQLELAELTDQSISLEDLERKAESDLQSLLKAGKKLTELRRQAAIALEQSQINALKMLAMEKVRFQASIYPIEPTALGSDRIVFEFSPNLGEPLQPLAETASGGEMSRFLLALKTCFVKHKTQELNPSTSSEFNYANVGTMVFDEIDAGVSGRVAQAIATQLWQLSRSSQVLCVTHQPLIAAIADRHFHVSKQVIGDRTQVQIRLLELEERKQELAQIASGMTVEEGKKKKSKNGDKENANINARSQAIAFAESLLEQAAAIKANI
jgi:DNA repair protein RecN (Recombination protein N)